MNDNALLLGIAGSLLILFKVKDMGGSFQGGSSIDNVLRWSGIAIQEAEKQGVDFKIILGIVWQESDGNPEARGKSNELGLMQLKPIAFDEVGIKPTVDPVQNIRAGTKFFAKIKRLTGDTFTALRAYNRRGTNVAALSPTEGSAYAMSVVNKVNRIKKEIESNSIISDQIGLKDRKFNLASI